MWFFSDYWAKNAMSYRGVGHVIFSLHLGVGHSVLLQLERVGHDNNNNALLTLTTKRHIYTASDKLQ